MKAKTRAAVAKKKDVDTRSRTEAQVDTQIYAVTITVVGLIAACAGIWALACLLGGTLAEGGPAGVIAGWVRAVFGS